MEEATSPLAGWEVLAVDDTPANLQVLAQVLTSEGARVRVAKDGEGALASARARTPDLILLDVQMPGLSGLEVCRLLKADPALAAVPVIFLSAAGLTEDIVHGFEAGAADYVTKPFRAQELMARVRLHLGLTRALAAERRLVAELQEALGQVKLLSGLVPICGACKKIRDDHGFWQQMERYIESHSEAHFSHGICPECMESLYPEIAERLRAKRGAEG